MFLKFFDPVVLPIAYLAPMKKLLVFALLLGIGLYGCVSVAPTTANTTEAATKEVSEADANITLANYLRRFSGVTVSGDCPNASVRIRGGMNSFSLDTSPLFVLNGSPIEGGLAALCQLVSVQDIKSVQVLKNASDTGMYGVRGANGVIVINLKN